MVDLLQGTEGRKGRFVEELLSRWQQSSQSPAEPLPAYRKKDGEWYAEGGVEVLSKLILIILLVENHLSLMPMGGPISVRCLSI